MRKEYSKPQAELIEILNSFCAEQSNATSSFGGDHTMVPDEFEE